MEVVGLVRMRTTKNIDRRFRLCALCSKRLLVHMVAVGAVAQCVMKVTCSEKVGGEMQVIKKGFFFG